MIGQTFGHLYVSSVHGVEKGRIVYLCTCTKCGCRSIHAGYYLRRGDSQKCWNCDHKTPQLHRSGLTVCPTHRCYEHDEKRSLRKAYYNMKARCYNPAHPQYRMYGAKGVRICDWWLGPDGFTHFRQWALGNGYSEGLHLDKDKLGNGSIYSPLTCCWLSPKENLSLRPAHYKTRKH